MLQCQECGRKTSGRKCPKCGSYDLDLAPTQKRVREPSNMGVFTFGAVLAHKGGAK
jgi:rRNA maturation endonuclease Nob1